MGKYKYNKLRGYIYSKFDTLKECSDALGITTQALRNKLLGKSDFKLDEMVKIKEMLDLTDEELVETMKL